MGFVGLGLVASVPSPSVAKAAVSSSVGVSSAVVGAPVLSGVGLLATTPVPTAYVAPGGSVATPSTFGGSNGAAPGVVATAQSVGDPVDPGTGDFSQSATDVSVPTFGPALGFDRSYDAGLAQQEALTGSPGALGYGWSDNLSTSLTTGETQPGDLYTLDGTATDNGDGGVATGSPLDSPEGETLSSGNLYIADSADNRVQEIPGSSGTQWGIPMTAGNVYTIAGSASGTAGASGNGASTSSSLLDDPTGVAIDSAGNLYIADMGNNRVEELAVSSGTQWGIPVTQNCLYAFAGAADRGAGDSGNGTLVTSSDVDHPTDVVASGGNLYIADSGNNRILEVPTAGGPQWGMPMTADDIYRIVGESGGSSGTSTNGTAGPSAGLDDPTALAVTAGGGVIVTDFGNNRVVQMPASGGTNYGVSMSTGDVYTIAGNHAGTAGYTGDGGVGTSGYLDGPDAVQINGINIYIADTNNNRIQELAGTAHSEFGVTMTANDLYTIAGSANGVGGYSGDSGSATSALLDLPEGVHLDSSGDLDISDTGNDVMRQVNVSTAHISTIAGTGGGFTTVGDGGPATGAGLADPQQTATDSAGNVYVADTQNDRIQEIAAVSHTQWGISMTKGDVYTIAGLATDTSGSSTDGAVATSYALNQPDGVAIDPAGDLFVDDTFDDNVLEVPAQTGTFWGQSMTANHIYVIAGTYGSCGHGGAGGTATAATICGPRQMVLDANGDVIFVERTNDEVQEIAAATGTQWGISMTANHLYTVAGVAATSGDTGDSGSALSALLNLPCGVTVDAAGDLLIGDSDNNRVQEVAAISGTQWGSISMTANHIYTIVGSATGTSGTSGDGAAATSALLDTPNGLAVDSSGDLYIADTANNRVQEVAATTGTQWGSLLSVPMTADDIYTIAGSATGYAGFGGDGNYANVPFESLLSYPQDVAIAADSDLYVSDGANDRLREIADTATPLIPVTPAGSGVTYNDPSGAQDTFYTQTYGGGPCRAPYQLSGNSTSYCTLSDVTASLNLGTSYSLVLPTTQTNTYNATTGLLTAETDVAGDTLNITYNSPAPGSGHCPSAASSCTTMTAANGRALTIGANSAGEVTSVTDPMGRAWAYAYSGGNLTSATDPLGNKTSYTYDTTNPNPMLVHDILTVTNPDGQTGGTHAGTHTTNSYDTSGRVITQTDPSGWETSFNYNGLNASTGDGIVVVTDPDGNQTAYTYTSGALTGTDVGYGAPGDTVTNDTPDPTTVENDATATAVGTTTDTYNVDGDVTSDEAPLGDTTTTGYTTTADAQNCATTAQTSSACGTGGGLTPPSVVAAGGTITPPASAPPIGVTYSLVDTHGNTLWTTTGVYQPGASTASYSQTTYSLYTGNSVTLGTTTTNCGATPPSPSLPCATINADKVVTQLTYDSAGDLASSSTPDGNGTEIAETTYAYDGDGEQTSTTSPDGNLSGATTATTDNYTTTSTYDADGNTLTTTQAGGILGTGPSVTPRTTTDTYDADNNQITSVSPRGYTTTTTYTADDQPTVLTDPDGNATLTCYDGDNNTTETVPPVGVAANTLTAASCPTTYTTTDSATRLATDATTNAYDAEGNPVTTTTPAPAGQTGSETTTDTYDGDGNLIETSAPPNSDSGGAPNQVTYNTYNADDQQTSQATGYGSSATSTTSYCYDPSGNETAVVAPDGNTASIAPCSITSPWASTSAYQTTYSYDSVGEQVSTTTPDTTAAPSGATTDTTYDPSGNIVTSVDPDGVTTTTTYTPTGAEASRAYSGSSSHPVAYTYDANGSRITMVDGTGTVSYAYDPFAELTSEQNGAGNTVSYGYNADGDNTGITYPLGAGATTWATTDTVTYTYDHADQTSSVTDFSGNTIAFTSNANGLPTNATLGGSGDSVNTTYSAASSEASIDLIGGGSTLDGLSYSDAPSGATLTETDSPATSDTPTQYGYNSQRKTTSVIDGESSPANYTFDASGDLTTLPDGATASYDDADELTSSTLSGTTTNYEYNADGERSSETNGAVQIASAGWNSAGELASYDGDGLDLSASVYNGDGLLTSYSVTPAGGGSPSPVDLVWGGPNANSQILQDGRYAYIYASGFSAPLAEIALSSGAISYLFSDATGSVRALVSSSGSIGVGISYDPWGNVQGGAGGLSGTAFAAQAGYLISGGFDYSHGHFYESSTSSVLASALTESLTNVSPSASSDTATPGSDGSTTGISSDVMAPFSKKAPKAPNPHPYADLPANYNFKRNWYAGTGTSDWSTRRNLVSATWTFSSAIQSLADGDPEESGADIWVNAIYTGRSAPHNDESPGYQYHWNMRKIKSERLKAGNIVQFVDHWTLPLVGNYYLFQTFSGNLVLDPWIKKPIYPID
jgi:YD repeat-containing protein